jgi:hypothetical protein
MPAVPKITPKNFYLNEHHELARGEKEGGGRVPAYTGIDWGAKGSKIGKSLAAVQRAITGSKDPLRGQHYFALTTPVVDLAKRSKDRKKAPQGIVSEQVNFAGDHSQVFRRLGLDLIDVTNEGTAIVHIRPERIEQLMATTATLSRMGLREQARWATIDAFGLIPSELRIDDGWMSSLHPRVPTDAVIEFQPLLTRTEIDKLLRSISALLRTDRKEELQGIGADFSGRNWVRGKITPETLRDVARTYYSVQTVHSPLLSSAAAGTRSTQQRPAKADTLHLTPELISSLPAVAVLDTGIPSDHLILAPYRRGSFIAPDSCGAPSGDHGSFVASRVVFGDPDFGDGPPTTAQGQCRYYDALVAKSDKEIDDKSVTRAIEAVVGTARDVRVFNLSFDTAPLELLDSTKQRENLILVQDLDNLIFQSDVLVVVSAGNSQPGVQPAKPYPLNFEDPQWRLGAWARSFNSLTCGSYVGRLASGGIVNTIGWPSPFTRVGPGLCASPKPDFSANGGNAPPTMKSEPGLGVWGLSAASLWEDQAGTSFAAPLLARECALSMQLLQRVCQQGAHPYSALVKAFLALTAIAPKVDGAAATLAELTLGMGTATCARLERPPLDSAIFLWQGTLEGPSDIARVQLPVPKVWYNAAQHPTLRACVCWDPPVNAAANEIWATRKVSFHLKTGPNVQSLHGSRTGHSSYPFIDRSYDLGRLPKGVSLEGDVWLIELSYEQIADYYPALTFTAEQRVAFALELYDRGQDHLSPQAAVQALPSSLTMTRLSLPPQRVGAAVVIKPTL